MNARKSDLTAPPVLAILLHVGLLSLLAGLWAPMAAAEEIPPPEGWELRGDPAAGRAEFLKKCAVCHGENGDGQGRLKLDPPPRDLGNAEYMRTRTDWQIFLAIRDGGAAVGMAQQMIPWGGLMSEEELHDVGAYVRSLTTEDEEDAAHEVEAESGTGGR